MTESRADSDRPVVEMRDISISFPGVKALQNVAFRLFPGEVHALMGENGAGKSTLIKALTGVYSIDSGSISVHGTDVAFSGPGSADRPARRSTPERADRPAGVSTRRCS